MSVCLSTCIPEKPRVQTKRNFRCMLPVSWLDLPLMTVQYIMYFRFCWLRFNGVFKLICVKRAVKSQPTIQFCEWCHVFTQWHICAVWRGLQQRDVTQREATRGGVSALKHLPLCVPPTDWHPSAVSRGPSLLSSIAFDDWLQPVVFQNISRSFLLSLS